MSLIPTMKNKKIRLYFGAFLAMAAISLLSVNAEDFPKVPCTYTGTWQGGNSEAGSGPIQWKVLEQEVCCGAWGIDITGSGQDSYGSYKLKGSCGQGECFVEQVYVSGQLNGSEYYYDGKYSINMQTQEMTKLSGNWGEKNKSPSGTFSITSFQCSAPGSW